ncbi:MAG: hypothetical protein ACE37E_01200 [Hyphomicrobiales bacterium]
MTDKPKRGPGRPPKAASVPTPPEPKNMFPVKIVRGYYPMNGSGKVAPGEVIELPVDEAVTCIEKGVAVRADALPQADDDTVEF